MLLAADGLPARSAGPWTNEKLGYLKKYAAAFTGAMSKKWGRLVYIDLLAGPGRDVIEDTREEFDGSPLIALNVRPHFHKLFLGDASPEHVQILRQRIPAEHFGRVDLRPGDCHERMRVVLRELTRGTLGLAFVDPEGFEVRFELFRQLAQAPVDILFLFPTGGVTRNLRLFALRQKSPMDGLIEQWRELPSARRASGGKLTAGEEASLKKSLVSEFRERMRAIGFAEQDRDDPALVNAKRSILFHLLFFSRHKAGLTIWKKIKKIGPDEQRTLGLTYEDPAP
jgi:three-Cys-motif partner protein